MDSEDKRTGEFVITGYYIRIGFRMQVAKTPAYSIMWLFTLSFNYTIAIH